MSAVAPSTLRVPRLPDPLLFWSALALSLVGLIMVGSASVEFAEANKNKDRKSVV